ncbi:transcription initiation protein [alpha proteobacterium AAP38]|uniref:YciI family protein n=1 Tax=Niveispirillum sp. TaxID=1917217 RepID=UPI0006B8BE05|nr:transcription initiation protein [alpha proteobacterium AAP38]
MAKFMLILRENPATFAALSPDEIQAIIQEYSAWAEKLGRAGKLAGGEKLRDEGGRHLSARSGSLVATDGPFAEAKEVVGGFFMIEAADYAEAETLAADCPHVKYGVVEIRQVDMIDG